MENFLLYIMIFLLSLLGVLLVIYFVSNEEKLEPVKAGSRKKSNQSYHFPHMDKYVVIDGKRRPLRDFMLYVVDGISMQQVKFDDGDVVGVEKTKPENLSRGQIITLHFEEKNEKGEMEKGVKLRKFIRLENNFLHIEKWENSGWKDGKPQPLKNLVGKVRFSLDPSYATPCKQVA